MGVFIFKIHKNLLYKMAILTKIQYFNLKT